MVIMNSSMRLLRSLSIQKSLLKKHNKTILLTLSSYTNAVSSVHHIPKLEQRRCYAEWAPNIVKSPYQDVELPEILLTDLVWTKIDKWADFPALVCGITGREMKYRQLRLLCRRLATSLLKDGFKPGDVIAVIMPNMPEFAVVALGAMEAGLTVTTVNPLYTVDEIVYQIKNSQVVAIVTIPEKLETVLEAKSTLEQENKEHVSKLKIICTNNILGAEPEVPSGVDRYSRLIGDDVDDSALSSLQTRNRTTNDVTFIPYSSGTTGRPKGVCLTHRNLISNVIALNVYRDIEDTTNAHQEILPFIIPTFHSYGFSLLLQGLFCGAKLITLPKFDEKLFLNVLTKNNSTLLYVAPPLVLYIGASPNVTRDHLRAVKHIICGAAPVAESDIMKCVEKSPPTVQYKQAYGLTETSPAITVMPSGIKKYNSVGPLVLNTLAKIADLQTNQPLGPNEEGEICVKGPQVMKSYLNNEKASAEVLDSEGWFHTGDIGYYDDDKHFFITDRLKELIKVKGFQVAPAELEGLLRTHPEVEESGVIGVPDPRKGETPIGFVRLRKGARVTKDELKAFLAPKVANYKQIDTIVFVESIPKTASGKISRKDLKENYLKSVNLEGYLETKKPKDIKPEYPNERN